MAAAAGGLVIVLVGLAMQGRTLRIGLGAVLPLAFLAVPLIQSVPLPMAVRHLFDPVGTDLLRDNRVVPTLAWPLSLDPPSTRVHVGRAAAALMAFMVAYHLASGQSRRHCDRARHRAGRSRRRCDRPRAPHPRVHQALWRLRSFAAIAACGTVRQPATTPRSSSSSAPSSVWLVRFSGPRRSIESAGWWAPCSARGARLPLFRGAAPSL